MTVKSVSFRGWKKCLKLNEGRLELIVTTEVGPRVIGLSAGGAENEFGVIEAEAGRTGGSQWRIYGGHRLWHSPERAGRTYSPDNGPIKIEQTGGRVRLVQPVEAETGIEKSLEISLPPGKFLRAVVNHRLVNRGHWSVELAPWALSVLAPGGVAVVPQPNRPKSDPFQPDRILSLWPYTRLDDPRLTIGRRYLMLRQDPQQAHPCKFGVNDIDNWGAYANRGRVFLKRFRYAPGAAYPDGGASVEVYTNHLFLELETLGPLVRLEPGAAVEHREEWLLLEGVATPAGEREVSGKFVPALRKMLGRIGR